MKKSLSAVLLCAAVLALTLTACGSKAYGDYESPRAADNGYTGYANEALESKADGSTGLTDNLSNETPDAARKIIQRVNMEVQTKTYDALIKAIKDKMTACGGYIESSRENSYGSRNAEIVLRIPAERLTEFTGTVEQEGTVVSSHTTTDDVTLAYVDIESRVSALRAEQTSLLAMLEKADNLNDLLTIQSRVTEVTAELESYESRLRTYDSLVSYSTVTLNIYEVERVEPVKELTPFEEIAQNLRNNCEDIGAGFVSFFVWFVSALPYLVLLAAAVLIVWLIIRRRVRKSRQKKAEKASAAQPPFEDPYKPQ